MISQMTQSVHSASPLSTSDDGQDEMQKTSSNTSSPNSGWKAVGSPPRGPGTRPSLTQTSNITSKSADHIPLDHTFGRLQDYAFPPVRKNSASAAAAVAPPPWAPVSLPTLSSSVSSSTAAGGASVAASFFQPQERRQSLVSDYPDIASVPMLPEVSTEPFFREYRSMSYSVEHDDYFNRGIPQHLMTMCEEENGDDLLSKALDDELLAAAQLRARSKSSAAAFDIWHPNHPSSDDAQSWRMAQLANQRRSSVTAPQSYISSLYTAPYLSAGDQDRLNAVRRFSLSPIPDSTNSRLHTAASAAAPIDGSTLAFLNQRRHSLATPSPGKFSTTQNMDDIVDVLRNLKMDEEASKAEYDLPVLFPPEAMGKGVNLDDIPEDSLFYVVEFKRGRSDMYFSYAGNIANRPVRGDYVIVEGDRGHDLGKVTLENVGRQQLLGTLQQQQQHSDDDGFTKKKEVYVKRILRIARSNEVALTMTKNQDESKALMVCQSKVRQRKMPMQIVDAEYQWDRRKLTFYFVADRRVDFRDLVRDLFKLYKTRIWMCAVNTT